MRSKLVGAVLATVVSGCVPAATPKAAPPPKVPFAFSGSETCKPAGSAKVTLAIVAPQWSQLASETPSQYTEARKALYDEFSEAMKNDFFTVLSCKGLTTKGPFRSYDEMVFPERQGSDLVLVPEMNVRVGLESEAAAPEVSAGTLIAVAIVGGRSSEGNQFVLKGTATLTGEVALSLRESLTNTRMWTRRIPVEPMTFAYKGTKSYPVSLAARADQLAYADPAFLAELRPRLATIYSTVLSKTSSFMNVEELQSVKQQSLEPRRKAVVTTPP